MGTALVEGGTLLLRVAKKFRSELDTRIQKSGVNCCEFFLLHILSKHGSMTQGALSQQTTIDRTSLVSLLDDLESKNWVARTPMPDDRRANLVELTASGGRVHEDAYVCFLEFEKSFLNGLGENESRTFVELLRRLA